MRTVLPPAARAIVAVTLVVASAASARAQDEPAAPAPRTSVVELRDREAQLLPIGEIAHVRIDESSALVAHRGWFLTLNDSGGEPELYAARDPLFRETVVLPVTGAANVDWEALTVLGDRVVVCDVGDNARARSDLTLYATTFAPGAPGKEPPTLALDAAYPIGYPDGAHDCEAAFERDGKLHLIVKNRGEPATDIFRFDTLKTAGELGAERRNVAVRVASLPIPAGEQVTDVALHRGRGVLAVLTYGEIRFHALADPAAPPTHTIALYARQCEALTFHGDDLVLTNEQRDVFRLPNALELPVDRLFPVRPRLQTPRLDAKDAALERDLATDATPLATLHLRQAANDDDLRAAVVGDRLHLVGDLAAPADSVVTNQDSARLGTSVLLVFPRERRLRLVDDDLQVAVVVREDGTVTPLRVWTSDARRRPELMPGARCTGAHAEQRFRFRLSLPLADVLPPAVQDRFHMNVVSLGLRRNAAPLTLSGDSIYAVLRPGMAADVTIGAPEATAPAGDAGPEKDE